MIYCKLALSLLNVGLPIHLPYIETYTFRTWNHTLMGGSIADGIIDPTNKQKFHYRIDYNT